MAELSGLSISFISDLERKRAKPSLSALGALATALGMTSSEILREDEWEDPAITAFEVKPADTVHFVMESSPPSYKSTTGPSSLPPGLLALFDDPQHGPSLTPEWLGLLASLSRRAVAISGKPLSKEDFLEIFLHLRRIIGR